MTKKKTPKLPEQVPFDENGNMLGYISPWGAKNVEMRDNVEFEATLSHTGVFRGRSAATFYWKDENGVTYPMFLNVMSKSVPLIVDGKLSGKFVVIKRGQNYSVCPAKIA